jgi:sigma-B regulation protein RsbU (phosphoserine phosphatase)
VTTLNRTIYRNIRRTKMDKTLTFALVNCQNGQWKVVGQHEELLVIRKKGQVERMDMLELGFPPAGLGGRDCPVGGSGDGDVGAG